MTIRTRFAPSPTGRLHVGNIRTALHNWMFSRAQGGEFFLRIDDTDAARSKEEYVTAIRADLAWLGLYPDGEHRQSEQFTHYEEQFQALVKAGRIYPAYESAQELELMRKVLLGRGRPPIYDRAALSLSETDRAGKEADGIKPHWRFKLNHDAMIEWDDAVRGPQKFDPSLISDPVIRRADGSWLYMLPSVIDDISLSISHIVRGEDHVTNSAAQIQMFEALGAMPPAMAHTALLVGKEGKLSKRLGSLGVDSLQEKSIEGVSLTALLARIGTSAPVIPVTNMNILVEEFSFDNFGRAPARFDEGELTLLNQKIVHMLDYDAVKARLPADMDAAAWAVIRPNVANIRETANWWSLVTGPVQLISFDADDRAFIAQALTALEAGDWGDDIWKSWTEGLKLSSGRKGRRLFQPLRRALTGLDHGPEMAALLPLIGREAAIDRLKTAL